MDIRFIKIGLEWLRYDHLKLERKWLRWNGITAMGSNGFK